MHGTGKYSIGDLAELFSISRPAVLPDSRSRSAEVRCGDHRGIIAVLGADALHTIIFWQIGDGNPTMGHL